MSEANVLQLVTDLGVALPDATDVANSYADALTTLAAFRLLTTVAQTAVTRGTRSFVLPPDAHELLFAFFDDRELSREDRHTLAALRPHWRDERGDPLAFVDGVEADLDSRLRNGSGEAGLVGGTPDHWLDSGGQPMLVADDEAYLGQRSMKITNVVAADSFSSQTFPVIGGQHYDATARIKTSALPSADTGFGANIKIADVTPGMTFETLDLVGDVVVGIYPAVGIQADDLAHDWTYVRVRFVPSITGTALILLVLGQDGTQSGIAWFDDVAITHVSTGDRTYRLYPAPDRDSGAFTFPFGEPFGRDYPANALVTLTADRVAPPVWLEATTALDTLAASLALESANQDLDMAATCRAVSVAFMEVILRA